MASRSIDDEELNQLVDARVSEILAKLGLGGLGGGLGQGGGGGQLGSNMLGLGQVEQQPMGAAPGGFLTNSPQLGAPPGVPYQAAGGGGLMFGGGSPFKPDFSAQRINNSMVLARELIPVLQQLYGQGKGLYDLGKKKGLY